MNILHITTELGRGGIERLICDLSKLQIQQGHCVRVLTICKRGDLEQELLQIGASVDCYGAKGNWKKRGLLLCWWLRGYLRQHKIDAVMEHCCAEGYVSRACTSAGVPYMVSVIHNTYYGRFRHYLHYRLQHRIFLKRYSHFVAVSESVRKFEIKRFGTPPWRIKVIPNGLVIDRFKLPVPTPEDKKQLLGFSLKRNEVVVGTVGNLRPQKNHKMLLYSWAKLISQCHIPLKLAIVGGGSLLEDLQKLRDSLGLTDSVFFLGTRYDVPLLLKCFDIFVMSSKHEGHPIGTVEAMASGLPVVATNVAGLRDIVQDGINGLLVELEDAEGLAGGLRKLVLDADLRSSMGRAGRKNVEKDFSIQQCAKLYEKSLLESPLKRHNEHTQR
jgi:glycosyltransferase involved in cell wall biosynthesis